MSDKIVDSKVNVKIEEDVPVETEVDSDDLVSSVPIIGYEQGDTLEIEEVWIRPLKPKPIDDEPSGSSYIAGSESSGGRVKSHVCLECDRAFSFKNSLKRHINCVHLNLKKFVCGECDREFTRQEHLKSHFDSVHMKLKKYSCRACNGVFTEISNLKKHVDTVHHKLRRFVCGECDRAFSEKRTLRKHLDAVHLT